MIGKGTTMLKSLISVFFLVIASGLIFLTMRIPSWVTLAGCGMAIGAIALCYSRLRKEVVF